MYLDKSPEYWAGWALAYYQWYTCRTFIKINKAVPINKVVNMYDVYHEMDITQFVDTVNELWDNYFKETNLKRIRKYAGLTQKQLAELSGVPIRQIQLFEQRQRDINHTKARVQSYVCKRSYGWTSLKVYCYKNQKKHKIGIFLNAFLNAFMNLYTIRLASIYPSRLASPTRSIT